MIQCGARWLFTVPFYREAWNFQRIEENLHLIQLTVSLKKKKISTKVLVNFDQF